MIIKINGTDYSGYVVGYEVLDNANVLLKSSRMASGVITQIYAPYTETEIKVKLKLNQSQIESLFDGLELSNTVQYYSAKTGATKTALFSYKEDGYRLKRKTDRSEQYDTITLTFTKIGEVSP